MFSSLTNQKTPKTENELIENENEIASSIAPLLAPAPTLCDQLSHQLRDDNKTRTHL